MGRRVGRGCCGGWVRTGSPSNTMWPGPRPTSLPSGIVIHPTVWPQLRLSLDSNHTTSSPHSPSPSTTPPDFSTLNPVSKSEIHKVLMVSSTFLLSLTPSTTASYSLVSPLGLVSMALSSTGLSPTCHIAPSVSDVITLFRPCVPPPVAFPKAPFLVPCFSSCTLPLSALSSPFQ